MDKRKGKRILVNLQLESDYIARQDEKGICFYNVVGAPPLVREGKYDIIPVNEFGVYNTSTPMFDYGAVIDQYYYVDGKGTRTEIDNLCVNIWGTGGSNINGIETHHTEIEVTHSECGEDFMLEGSIR